MTVNLSTLASDIMKLITHKQKCYTHIQTNTQKGKETEIF